MTVKQLIRLLQDNGWVEVRHKGSHKTYKNSHNASIITVSVHGNCELRKGTLKSILKKAGISLKN